jgi:pimeloyl-ACP methyl ester carboxylesterase
MAATNNPLEGSSTTSPAVSAQTFTIAGILVTVHGIAEVPPTATSVACLWLLNPRLQTKETMAPVAAQIISAWNARQPKNVGLIAAAFDQRNHGSRLVDPVHNEAWRQGNPRHAQDMFGCYHGTAADCSQLIDHLPSYVFHTPASPRITTHFALGISLGGHATWHVLLSDTRVTAGVVVIGCPDYTRLMTDRARLSKRPSYTQSSPPGAAFLGSEDFPPALLHAVSLYDPAGKMLPGIFNPVGEDLQPSELALLRMKSAAFALTGKKILNLSGKEDKLVPYAAGEAFLKVFKEVVVSDRIANVEFEDVLFDGVGHAYSPDMADKATGWLCAIMDGLEASSSEEGRKGSSKI